MNKKILILAHDFPPLNSIGAQRPLSWFQEFKNHNLEPIVITKQWDDVKNSFDYYKPSKDKKVIIEKNEFGKIIRVPFHPNLRDRLVKYDNFFIKIFRKVFSLFIGIAQYYFHFWDNNKRILIEADKYIKDNQIDYLLVTSEPFILMKYGYLLSKKHKIKWIADYRDEWTTNTLYSSNQIMQLQFKLFLRAKELKFLKHASLITTASPNYGTRLSSFLNKEVETIFNGFFTSEFENLPNLPLSKSVFEISFIGSLYNYQPLELFLTAYKKFVAKHKPGTVKLVFYGANYNTAEKNRILGFDENLNEYIETTDRLHRTELHKTLNLNSSIFLLLADPEEVRIPAKIFDYIALKRQILLVKDDQSILSQIINESKSGRVATTTDQILENLEFMYHNREKIESNSTGKYSRRNQTKSLADLILKI